MSDLEEHNRKLQEELDRANARAEAFKSEFLENNNDTQNLADAILRENKDAAAQRMVWLLEHAEKDSTMFQAAKYILEYGVVPEDAKSSLEKLVSELSKGDT